MKKSFKLLLLGAFALSLGVGFVGCNYVKESDFKEVCEKIDAMEADIAALKAAIIPGGKVVKDVTGPVDGKLTVAYTDATSREITLPSGKVPYVEKNDDGSYTLYIVPKGGTDYVDIKIPTAENELSKIDILGWMTGKGKASEDISAYADVHNDADDRFEVNYAWIEKFFIEDAAVPANFSGTSNDATKEHKSNWSAQTDVDVKNVLNTLDAERNGILVQVHPASVDMTKLKFTLENSKGEALPIVMMTPELVSGYLKTRAAASSALYFIPWTYQDKSVTYDKSTGDVAPANKIYAGKFVEDVRYTLVTSSGLRSEYTHWTVLADPTSSREAAVESLNTETAAITSAVNNPVAGQSYKVLTGTDYSIEFDNQTSLSPFADPTDLVVDYYSEVKDNNDYVRSQFNVTFDKKAGTFKVGKMPDNLTLATFTLTVYKLGVDGKIYIEDIVIYPVRPKLSETIFDGAYTITDENTYATSFQNNILAPSSGQLSATNTADMDPMFTLLSGHESGIGGMTMKERWQNITYGAKFWTLSSVTIGGKKVDGTEYVGSSLLGYAAPNNKPDLDEWKTMFYMGGSEIAFTATNGNVNAANPNLGSNPDSNGDPVLSADLYKAKFVKFTPAYAQADGSTPMFEIGKEYVLTFDFYDQATDGTIQNYLSSAVVKFIPGLPSLDGLFKKEDAYWVSNVLKAYYKAPNSWAASEFYLATYPWAPSFASPYTGSTFYNVYSTTDLNPTHSSTTPYDGGFIKFGQAANTDKQWVDASSSLAVRNPTTQKVGDVLVTSLVKIGNTNGQRSIVELQNQYPASKDVKGAYGATLDMSIKVGKYIGVYNYSDYDIYATALENLDFQMEIMSALEKGSITGAKSGVAEAASVGDLFKLDAEAFDAFNYNNSNEYGLFKEFNNASPAVLVYKYTYIKAVEFFIPQGVTIYNFADVNGDVINSSVTTEIEAVAGDSGYAGHINIKGNGISNTTQTKIGVRVTDRFGKIKEETIDLTLKVN